jgi:anti-anti-sigma factor
VTVTGIESDESMASAPDFSCTVHRDAGRVVVTVEGDVDIATAPVLYATLREAADGPGGSVVADFAEVGFIDSSGVQCLLAVQHEIASHGATLTVQRARENVLLVFELLGLTDLLLVGGAS